MRILMINYEFPPIGGGTGNACYYMLREFAKKPNLKIDLVTYSPDNKTRTEQFASNIQIHYVACGKKQSLHSWKTTELLAWLTYTYKYLRNHLQTQKYHLIHCWSGWPAGILGYLFRKHAPYIIALRGSDVPGHTPRTAMLDALVMRRLSRHIWGKAHTVTSVSQYLARLASQTAKITYQIINNGIDTAEFYPAPTPNNPPPINLLYVGRMAPHKGVDDLIEALRLLKNETSGELHQIVNLTIVGSGSMATEIQDSIKTHQLDKAINLLGILPHKQLPAIYRQHDIFIFPCHSDAMANVILEAIASGLAIISTRTGGAELLDGNGLLINSGDPNDIKDKISTLIKDHQNLANFKIRSTQIAKTIGWDHCCQEYQKIYNQTPIKPAN